MQKYRVHELVQYNYSDIGEYIDEYHTDRPLRNDILVEKLNEYDELDTKCSQLQEENKQLKKELQNIKEYIDNSIERNKEAIEWGKNIGAGVGAMGFYTHMLEEMKKDWFE